MSDAKYFQRGKVQELRNELNSEKNDPKHVKKKAILKRIVANLTMGNDMSPLLPDVLACMDTKSIEVKKMVYFFLINYARAKPDVAQQAIGGFLKDSKDPNPHIRALAIRTMGYLNVDEVIAAYVHPLKEALHDQDPFVRKTAALGVAKLYFNDKALVEREGLLEALMSLLSDSNPAVIANAVAALTEISERSEDFQLTISVSAANKLVTALSQCSEWGQTYMLETLMFCVPQEVGEAEMLAERIIPRLQHANAGVVLTAVKVVVYLMNYMSRQDDILSFSRRLGPPLITLLASRPEIQYVTLRNILLILQRRPILAGDIRVFFCKYDDPIYVKLTKLDILSRLTTPDNVGDVLLELEKYATEIDVDFVRKSVRLIGKLAIRIDVAADECIETLLRLVGTGVNYVLQEAVIVIKDIFRRYPGTYEGIIGRLCEDLGDLDEPEAKASMIWILGQYSERIESAECILEGFLDAFPQEPPEVKMALLTATMKLFIKRPAAGQDLVSKALKWATEDRTDPDIRDRGYIYWRLLSTDPTAAKHVILADHPGISMEGSDGVAPALLDELLLHISSITSIHHRPPATFISQAKVRSLEPSKVLDARHLRSHLELEAPPRRLMIAPDAYDMGLGESALIMASPRGNEPSSAMQDMMGMEGWGGEALPDGDESTI